MIRMRDHGHGVWQGALWSALNSAVSRIGQFAIGVIVARLISPREFGVFVVALTIYTVVINVSEIGVSSALIREGQREAEIAPTVTTIALVTSTLLTMAMVAAATPLAASLGAPQATAVIRVLAMSVLLAGPSAVPAALLARDYRQDKRFIADMANFIAANGVLVAGLLSGGGVMALAWSRVAGQAVSTLALLAMTENRYLPRVNIIEARALLRFGIPLAGANLVSFSLYNVDFVIVGHELGPTALGVYNLAYNISSWPVGVFSTVLASVALPAFSRVRNDHAQLVDRVRLATSGILGVSAPVSALTIALASPLVVSIYGTRWHDSANVLALLAAFGLCRVLIMVLSDLITALGMTRWLLILQILWIAVLAPLMLYFVGRFGAPGAALAHLLTAVLVVLPAYMLIVRRSVRHRSWKVGTAVVIPMIASLAAGVIAMLASSPFADPWIALFVGCVSGGLVYLAVAGRWIYRIFLTISKGRLYRLQQQLPERSKCA